MNRNEKYIELQKTMQQWKIVIASINIKVKFPCRLFMEYIHKSQMKRTKQLKVDSKNQRYQYGQQIILEKQKQMSFSDKKQNFKIIVKLLSNKGFEFTAGSFIIQFKDFLNVEQTNAYRIAKSTDIDAQCFCKMIQPKEYYQEGCLKQIKQEFQQNSKLETQEPFTQILKLQYSKMILPQNSCIQKKYLKDSQKYKQYINDKFNSPKKASNKAFHQSSYKSPIKDQFYQSRYRQLQKQISYHSQLFEKQKEIINLLQNKYKQSLNQQQKLKITIHRYEIDCDEKRKRINILQDQKIELLKNNLKNEKQLNKFKQQMKQTLKKTIQQICQIFDKKSNPQKSFPNSKITGSILKNSVEAKISDKILKKDTVELEQEDFISQNYNLADQLSVSMINQTSNHYIQKYAVNNLRQTQRHQFPQFKTGHTTNQQLLQFCDCLDILKLYKTKIIQKVSQNANKISGRLAQLGQSNNIIKNKLKQNKQQFQNNQQALFSYLQQLQEGLERQLEITDQKEQAIIGYLSMIEDLSDRLTLHQARIRDLQEFNNKLEEDKAFIKAQLHQNNYIYSLREEQFVRKIQTLQNSLPISFNSQHFTNLGPHKVQILQTEIEGQCQQNPQSLLNQYSQRIRDKELQLIYERKEKQKLVQILQNKEQELRFAFLNKKKLQFAIKLKEKISSLGEDNHKSFEIGQQEQIQGSRDHMEQQFLKILT